ncbi:TPA: hypothetical protein ACH3X3_005816 [Trebouxia sp. C0006]
MLAKFSAHRFLAQCRALHAFNSTELICLHAPWSRGRSELSLFRTVDMASRSVTLSALDTPSSAEGIDHVSDRLSRLAAGPFPLVAPKAAAVLVPLFEDNDGVVRVLLTQRSANLSSHKGEVCLPGGKRDPEDADDVQCALREAQEELGLEPSSVQVIAQLPPFISKHKLSVTPVIGKIKTMKALTPNPSEVNAVFDMPLAAFLEDVPSHTSKDAEWQGIQYRLHYFEYNNFLVWGLTAAILIQVAQDAFGRSTDFLELTPGSRPYHQLFFNGERLLWRATQPL